MAQQPRNQSSNRRAGLRYERLFLLGSGGMASVHLALAVGPSGFNRLVVVKSMHQELSTQDDTYQMFLAEARLSARLNHPNVVQVSEVVEAPDGIMLVMEYLDGIPLSQMSRVAGEAFTLPMRLRAMCEVLAGLHYAHELSDFEGRPLGIVHRDVSPQNVFLTYDGRVKLLDFGIAKATNGSDQTQSGMIKGRIAYMPAEQLTGDRLDRRADIYAVGCLLWEMVAGSRLWANQNDRDIVRSVIAGRVPALSSRVEVDPELEAIVTRATLLEREQRYADADSMRADLEHYLNRAWPPVSARDIGDMLSRVSGSAREQRQRAIAEAIAKVDLNGTGEGEDAMLESASFDRLRTPSASRGSGTMLSVQLPTGRSGEHRLNIPAPSSGAIAVRELAPPSSRSGSGQTPTITQSQSKRTETGSSLRVKVAPRGLPRWSFGVMAVAAVALIAFVLKDHWRPAAPAAGTAAPVATAPAMRALTVDATPRDAHVFIDGQAMAGNPVVMNVVAGSEHVVRVEREGYQSSQRRIRVDDNVSMDVAMNVDSAADDAQPEADAAPASKSEGTARSGRVIRRAPRAVTAAPKAAPSAAHDTAPSCNPPYYFKDGIKTYKPGCI